MRTIRGPTSEEKRQIVQEMMAKFQGQYNYLSLPVDAFRHRDMHIIHFPQGAQNQKGESLELGIADAKEYQDYRGKPKSNITFLDIPKKVDGAMIGFNFLYFITRNVMERYNRTTPHFKLGGKFFGEAIGFLRVNKEGKEIVYPPLYNKGAIGMKDDGTFVFGRVTMPEQGLVGISLGKEEVNLTGLG